MSVQLQDCKVECVIPPQTITIADAATTYGYIDTLGWDHLKLILVAAIEASSSNMCDKLSISEGTNSTAATAITALLGGTAFTIPLYDTDEGATVVFDIDLRKRERYLRVNHSSGADSTCAVIGILSRGKVMPGTDDGSVASGAHVIA